MCFQLRVDVFSEIEERWPKEHVWKAYRRRKFRGFKSHSFRQQGIFEKGLLDGELIDDLWFCGIKVKSILTTNTVIRTPEHLLLLRGVIENCEKVTIFEKLFELW